MAALVYEVSFKGTASDTLRCDPSQLNVVLERLRSYGLELLEARLLAESAAEQRD